MFFFNFFLKIIGSAQLALIDFCVARIFQKKKKIIIHFISHRRSHTKV